MKIKGITAFFAAIFVGAIFVLGIKLLTPASIQIFVEGRETAITQIPGLFTITDVVIIAVSAAMLGISGIYLLFFDSAPRGSESESEKKDWEQIMKTLDGDEKIIYEIIFSEEGIMYQSDLVGKTGFPKAKVTRCLDALENKKLVERKRKGMGNLVLLK